MLISSETFVNHEYFFSLKRVCIFVLVFLVLQIYILSESMKNVFNGQKAIRKKHRIKVASRLPDYLPDYLPAFLPTYLPACLPVEYISNRFQ